MIETPQVVYAEAQLTAVIRLVVPRSEIQKVMGPAIGEIYVLGPESSADASTWCTELNRPIIS